MVKTHHAIARSQQRGIPLNDMDLIAQIGTLYNRPGGAIEYTVRKRDISNMTEYLKKLIQKIDKLEGRTIVVKDNTILTAYHKRI